MKAADLECLEMIAVYLKDRDMDLAAEKIQDAIEEIVAWRSGMKPPVEDAAPLPAETWRDRAIRDPIF